MTEIAGLIAKFGWPVVLVGALVYLILHGEIHFRYPRK